MPGERSSRVSHAPHPSAAKTARAFPPRAFALELTKGCNLRCGYCYYAAREAAYDPKSRMTKEVAFQSVDVLLRDGPVDRAVHVHFFGGEPLLAFDLLVETTLYGESEARRLGRAITFEITTNGTRLEPDVIAFLNAHQVAVGISIDGPREVQDLARPLQGGSSYALAAPKIRALLASRAGTELAAKTHASVVLTRLEFDWLKIVRHLEELGFQKILLTPATNLAGKSNGILEADLPRAYEALEALAREYERRVLAGEPVAETWFPRLVGRILSGEKKAHFCSGGRDYLGVAASGEVALCYRFFEQEEFAMGSVQRGLEHAVTERLLAHPLDERSVCSRCWARHYCGGGCHHDNHSSQGAPETPNPISCELFRHGMDRALGAWALLSRAGRLAGRTEDSLSSAAMPPRDSNAQLDLSARPRVVSGTHARELGGERVVYDPATHEVVVLNEVAAFILERCDGEHTIADILGALEARYDAPRERLQIDLATTLSDLTARRLLQE
jgi:uncharacterized protein